jgi:two-component system, sensor histidine kinase PdtaS
MAGEIFELCRCHTTLTDEDIARLHALSQNLSTIANIEQADVFIDCLTEKENLAVVVSQAKPDSVTSSYKGSVVGLYAEKENEPSVFRSFSLGVGTKHVKAVTQENVSVIQTVEPIKNKGKVIGVLIIEKRVETDGQYSILNDINMDDIISDNSWLTKYIDLAIIMVNKEGIVCYRNTMANRLYTKLGYVEDILGMPYENILLHSNLLSTLDDAKQCSVAEVCANGLVLEVRQILVNKNGVSFTTIIRDVTDIHENEKQLVLKSVAIKEIHHRVKNSLQTIASTLSLQKRRSTNPEVRSVLQDVINRVLAISATHELLLSDDGDRVNIGDLIRRIADNHLNSFSDRTLSIHIKIDGGDFLVSSDIANSVAIVINELLQNSIKYAFAGRKAGEIIVGIQNRVAYSVINVTDNGRGFDVKGTGRSSLGLTIIEAVVKEKLHGRLELQSSEKGTNVCFDFQNQVIHMAKPMQA